MSEEVVGFFNKVLIYITLYDCPKHVKDVLKYFNQRIIYFKRRLENSGIGYNEIKCLVNGFKTNGNSVYMIRILFSTDIVLRKIFFEDCIKRYLIPKSIDNIEAVYTQKMENVICINNKPDYLKKDIRDFNRIPELLAIIENIWSKYPDLRLGQLILNPFSKHEKKEVYYMEDKEVIEKIEEYYKQ
jgi:hypothetical protein